MIDKNSELLTRGVIALEKIAEALDGIDDGLAFSSMCSLIPISVAGNENSQFDPETFETFFQVVQAAFMKYSGELDTKELPEVGDAHGIDVDISDD